MMFKSSLVLTQIRVTNIGHKEPMKHNIGGHANICTFVCVCVRAILKNIKLTKMKYRHKDVNFLNI
jgi:hypothetical protein